MTARNGYCRRQHGLLTSLGAVALLASGPAGARTANADSSITLSAPAGSLADLLRLIASRTGSEIITLERGLGQTRVTARTLRGTAAQMLADALHNTDYRAVQLTTGSFRIERRRAGSANTGTARRPVAPPPTKAGDIIVTASKFPVPLTRYPGSVVQLKASPLSPAMPGDDMDDISKRLPVLQGTELGEGRNKIFIRGIVDSSFNGATQPTASIYFGDAPLGFGSPSPSLKLYDISSVEVLEGPQGTLYGSGSLGGIVRIEPNAVDYSRFSGSVAAGGSATVGGAPGWDGSAMLNVPVVESRLGLRFVGYHEQDGGYLNNPVIGHDSNSVRVSGGRAALAAKVGDTITVRAGVLHQETAGRDAQYVNGRDTLNRTVRIAEPYANNLTLGYVIVDQEWASGLKLTSVSSLGDRSSFDAFDATPPGSRMPAAYQLSRSSATFAQELRLGRSNAHGVSWVIGAAYQRARDGQTRSFGVPDQPTELDEVTNVTYSKSLFGQGSFKLRPSLEATVGLRLTTARTDSDPSREVRPLIRGISAQRLDPTVALSWRLAQRTVLYARIQTGYRNGGMAVARGIGRVANFEADSVIMGEFGVRRLRTGARGLSGSAAVSYTAWDDIQGDLIGRRGSPYTTNIGDARVLALEATGDWTPLRGLGLGGSVFYTDSRLNGMLTGESIPRNRRLPDTPSLSGVAHGDYGWACTAGFQCRVGGAARYIGRSVLGPGALLDIGQGNYTVVDLSAGARKNGLDVSLSVDNLLNARGNRFAFGNPVTAYMRDQRVPVRPTTVRIGIGVEW